jgi:glucokinase
MSLAIGVDVGGTKIAAGLVTVGGAVLATARRPTPSSDSDAVLALVADVVEELVQSAGEPIVGVGVGVAGAVDAQRSHVYFAPNLHWSKVDARAVLENSTGLPVVIENDGNAAAWGEFRFGAGTGTQDLVLVTVGTGIGGGIVLGGSLFRGAHGAAGEIGHVSFVPDGVPCGCGRLGCWEQYASGNALVRQTRELAAHRRADAVSMLAMGDGTPEGIQGVHITEAAMAGDPVASEGLRMLGVALGTGLANLAAVLDPEIFVIGGGVCEAGDLFLSSARESLHAKIIGGANRPLPAVVVATLGNQAGMVGAADLARIR